MLAHAGEGARIRALKAVDRLLAVADREHGAQPAGRVVADKKFRGEDRDDFPLLGIGVLRLVNQDVVEPAIELEQHPGRDAVVPQQVERGQHQIVVVELRVQALALAIGVDQRGAEANQRCGCLERDGAVARQCAAGDGHISRDGDRGQRTP